MDIFPRKNKKFIKYKNIQMADHITITLQLL